MRKGAAARHRVLGGSGVEGLPASEAELQTRPCLAAGFRCFVPYRSCLDVLVEDSPVDDGRRPCYVWRFGDWRARLRLTANAALKSTVGS